MGNKHSTINDDSNKKIEKINVSVNDCPLNMTDYSLVDMYDKDGDFKLKSVNDHEKLFAIFFSKAINKDYDRLNKELEHFSRLRFPIEYIDTTHGGMETIHPLISSDKIDLVLQHDGLYLVEDMKVLHHIDYYDLIGWAHSYKATLEFKEKNIEHFVRFVSIEKRAEFLTDLITVLATVSALKNM